MHKSVLKKEVIEYLDPKTNENFIDSTIGQAGHSLEVLKKNKPNGKVLGIELDNEIYEGLIIRKIKRLVLVNDSFKNLKEIVKNNNFKPVSGILFDLGFLSWHIEDSGRGFSFKKNELLDMRYSTDSELTAQEIVNKWKEKEIEEILKKYGEERFSRRISNQIVNQRRIKPIKTTFDLIEIIKRAVPSYYRYKRIHFATKTFQALRIAVNDELNNLKEALPQALEVLEKQGRIVVISFHSLEDRIVKNFFKKHSKEKLEILTKKPITASKSEIINNPRSRSAKLRAAVKI
ncbi:MAG: 16S rRNA (cytosine(1402)-N(4))-methyltransferase RsmH [Candidatus Nealsonbacteria bacterium]